MIGNPPTTGGRVAPRLELNSILWSMELSVAIRRPAYRVAYQALRVYWRLARPSKLGVKVALLNGERVLLVRHTYGRSYWDLPGGSVKRHEPPLGAARREISEELGIEIDQWIPLVHVRGRVGGRQDILHCFRAEVREPRLIVDRGEIAAWDWFPLARLPTHLNPIVAPILARAPRRATPTRSCPGACW